MDDHVRIRRTDGLLEITLARPNQRNAITVAMYSTLADAFEAAARDENVRLIAIGGDGPDFCAGNDLKDFLNALPRESDEVPVWRFLRALARNPVPTIAAVQGNAVGIGTTMLLHCDLVVAARSTRFALPFVDLALVPEAASTLLLPRLAGRRRSARYLLLGEPFGADEALDIGLASHVVDDSEVRQKLDEITFALLAKPPQALRLTHGLLRDGEQDAVLDRMRLESAQFTERLQSQEARDSIAAFFERRQAAI